MILRTLGERPDADRTVVIFVSDHGDFAWHHGLCKKDLILYEDLLHVPAIICWPGRVTARPVDTTFTEHTDLMPTLLDLAGLPIPFGCQGRSFAPVLRGETDHHREEVHAEVCYPWMRNPFGSYQAFRHAWETADDQGNPFHLSAPFNIPGDYTKGLRTAQWSYNWYADGFEELYDLQADPDEGHNLAQDPGHDAILREYRTRLLEWLVHTADPRSPQVEQDQVRQYSAWLQTPGELPQR